MAKEGIPFIALFLVPALALAIFGIWPVAGVCLVLAAFMAFFFRDPNRPIAQDKTLILSPADGRVMVAEPIEPGSPDSPLQVSIFLSPMDVHINRSPMAGEILDVTYKRGAFHIASRSIASVENEQNIVTIKGDGITIVCRQIAGILARRIVLWKRAGDRVRAGERIGLMKFGSRMDLILPHQIKVDVRKGDRVVGGVTVIGRIPKEFNAERS
ncbi:MAG TPA: phosphatidylserine decarboxylase [Blastocatellia bacterium]